MRASTAFHTMLAIAGASVASVRFDPTAVVVQLHRRAQRPVRPYGWRGRACLRPLGARLPAPRPGRLPPPPGRGGAPLPLLALPARPHRGGALGPPRRPHPATSRTRSATWPSGWTRPPSPSRSG